MQKVTHKGRSKLACAWYIQGIEGTHQKRILKNKLVED